VHGPHNLQYTIHGPHQGVSFTSNMKENPGPHRVHWLPLAAGRSLILERAGSLTLYIPGLKIKFSVFSEYVRWKGFFRKRESLF
jgi:hypothetical protein